MKALTSGRKECKDCGWLKKESEWFTDYPTGSTIETSTKQSRWICANEKEWCPKELRFKDGIEKKEIGGFMLMKRRIRWTWLTKIS